MPQTIKKIIEIGNKLIGENQPCFIIVEAGVNHALESDDLKRSGAKSTLEVAFRMVDAAAEAKADAIKFQSFSTGRVIFRTARKPGYQVSNVGSDEEISYFNLIKGLETSKEDQTKIANYCKKKGIIFFSTPYDNESADFLDEEINVPLFKLASIELNNHLFLRYVAKKGKPLILSTGLSSIDDVRTAVKIAREEGFANRLVLLQCTSDYPTKPEEINLNVIKAYMKEFPDILIGFSDHRRSFTASIGAVALGAVAVEKHFTLDKTFKGPDHSSSLDKKGLCEWISRIRELEASMGSYEKKVTEGEKRNETMRKYIVITPQKSGTIIEESMLKPMRTGEGILPVDKNLKKIVGKTLKIDVDELMPLSWEMIGQEKLKKDDMK